MPLDPTALVTTAEQRALYNALKDIAPLPELSYKGTSQYMEGSRNEVLYPLIANSDVLVVAGAYFGDEGKGKTVHAIAHHKDVAIVARTNSGENAGHTVYDEKGRKYVFHLAPSGLLIPNLVNLIGCECVMDPISFMESEMKQLIDGGVPYKERLFLGNVHIVCPHHKLLDLVTSSINASTLKGMAPIHASKALKRGVRLDHVYNDGATLRARIKRDLDTFLGALATRNIDTAKLKALCNEANADGLKRIPDYVIDFVAAEDKVEYTARLLESRVRDNAEFPSRADVTYLIRKALSEGKKVLLEGPQSYWLSNAREKFWESSTSADTSAAGILATSHVNLAKYRVTVLNVHKTPASSRVGIGANPAAYVPQDFFSSKGIQTLKDLPANCCANFADIQKRFAAQVRPNGVFEPCDYEDVTGKYSIGVAMAIGSSVHHGECGSTTRKPRITGFFDCVLQYEVSQTQGPYLSISALDRGDDYDYVPLCIAYVYYNKEGKTYNCNGTVLKNFDIIKAGMAVPTEQAAYNCYPIIKLIPGWKDSPIAASKRKVGDPFPAGLIELLNNVEYFTGSQVISVGNGPKSDEIIYIKRRESPAPQQERTFIAVKPDGVQRGIVGEIIKRFEGKGFKLVGLKMLQPTVEQAKEHYKDLASKKFYKGLCEYFSCGPIVAMCWEGLDVIKMGRTLLGATRPADSLPGTIRGDLCVDVGRNIIHGSDSAESAQREIAFWFSAEDLVSWRPCQTSWIYE